MVMAVALIAVMNMCAKLITDFHDPIEKIFYRGLIALALVTIIMIVTKRFDAFKTKRPWAQLSRGLAGTGGLGCVFWAYSLMPMTEVTALMFTGGFMTLLISPFVLGERVGPYRWGAVIIGFIGALIIAQPDSAHFNALGVFASLLAAFIGGALIAVFLRSLGKTENAFTTVFYFLLIGVITTAPYMLFYGSWISFHAILPLLGMGIAGGISLLLKTEAYRHAEASLLTPVHYTAIVWAILFDILLWEHIPSLITLSGSALIIFANLFILWREHQHNKKQESASSCPNSSEASLPL